MEQQIDLKKEIEKIKEYSLSDQALGSIMMALQKGLLEQCDITEVLRSFVLKDTSNGLIVTNPPNFQIFNNG
jgi:hypothetical protein